jgi:hypothetical protein
MEDICGGGWVGVGARRGAEGLDRARDEGRREQRVAAAQKPRAAASSEAPGRGAARLLDGARGGCGRGARPEGAAGRRGTGRGAHPWT